MSSAAHGARTVPEANVVGNHYDKYGTRNPVARWLMKGFLNNAVALFRQQAPSTVLEVGCGEGHLADVLVRSAWRPDRFVACDLNLGRLAPDLDPLVRFHEASIYDLPYPDNAFDLVLCCEVLEHLDDPAQGLREVARVAARSVIISTPWEPVWRLMNLARGRYLRNFGNTPGHRQHFSRRGMRALAQGSLVVTDERHPLPWTLLAGTPRDATTR